MYFNVIYRRKEREKLKKSIGYFCTNLSANVVLIKKKKGAELSMMNICILEFQARTKYQWHSFKKLLPMKRKLFFFRKYFGKLR